MDGLFFLMSVVGVGVAMWWAMQNDAVPPDRPTTGLFALLPGSRLGKRRALRGKSPAPAPAPAPSGDASRRRRQL